MKRILLVLHCSAFFVFSAAAQWAAISLSTNLMTGHELAAIDTATCTLWYSTFYPSDTVSIIYRHNFCSNDATDSMTLPGKLQSLTTNGTGMLFASIYKNGNSIVYQCSPTLTDTNRIANAHGCITDISATAKRIVCVGVFDSISNHCIKNVCVIDSGSICQAAGVQNDLLFCDKSSGATWLMCANGGSSCLYRILDTDSNASAVSISYNPPFGPDHGIRSVATIGTKDYALFIGTDSVPSEMSSTILEYASPSWVTHARVCGRSFISALNDTVILYGPGVRTNYFAPSYIAYQYYAGSLTEIPFALSSGFVAYAWSKNDTLYAIGNFDANVNGSVISNGCKIFRGIIPTRVEKITNEGIKLYPNPAHDHISITGLSNACTIRLYSIHGSVLTESAVLENKPISFSYPPGIYIVHIATPIPQAIKLVIQ